jgi:hypothetical protein
MRRDIQFARYIKEEAYSRGLKFIEVDGRATIDENLEKVERHFRFSKNSLQN